MKKNYKKVIRWRAKHQGDFYYEYIGGGHFRAIRTMNELRQNIGDNHDFYVERTPCRVRSRRNMSNLDSWNDFNRSRDYGKSWKQYTNHRKQWMVGGDPTPKPRANFPDWLYGWFDL